MATYKARGNAHNVIVTYVTKTGERKQQWETYTTELEAMQRKVYIDYLQKNKRQEELLTVLQEYKAKRAKENPVTSEATESEVDVTVFSKASSEDNTNKTYRDFVEKWLPFRARKKRFSPNTYDSYTGILQNHILPYFGDRIMSTITSEDIDDFIDYLTTKRCKGSKSYGKSPKSVPTLASGTIKKCYTVFTSGFPTAKKWRYIKDIPESAAPTEKTKKRKAWDPESVFSFLEGVKEDKLLHLAVHLAFVCSLRAGETAGIDLNTIDFNDRSLWIKQEIQRVSDSALNVIPENEILHVFPKLMPKSKSSLIIKGPKTERSTRKQYLTAPLLSEIKERLEEIEYHKEFFGEEYHDHGLLICHVDGRPMEPKFLCVMFKRGQDDLKLENQIEFQGLRKSGQMHKVRLTQNNYQLVAESGGQSPEVLMSNYNEALDTEKRTLSMLVEKSFYPQQKSDAPAEQDASELAAILQAIQNNPSLSETILKTLLLGAAKLNIGKTI